MESIHVAEKHPKPYRLHNSSCKNETIFKLLKYSKYVVFISDKVSYLQCYAYACRKMDFQLHLSFNGRNFNRFDKNALFVLQLTNENPCNLIHFFNWLVFLNMVSILIWKSVISLGAKKPVIVVRSKMQKCQKQWKKTNWSVKKPTI